MPPEQQAIADAERFWSKVNAPDEHGDMLWSASQTKQGYGVFYYRGHKVPAHRFAWIVTNGPIPDDVFVLHNCPDGDNPLCVNPDHLFLGTQTDNVADMVAKGRNNKGEGRWSAKLTEDDVRCIRKRYAAGGISCPQLSAEYHLYRSAINKIVTRKTWKHVID